MFRRCIGAIIGVKGETIQRIKYETGARITIPERGSTHSDIEISASTRSAVCLARQKIELIVQRRNKRLTNFTCVRVDDVNIKDNFIKFKVNYIIA